MAEQSDEKSKLPLTGLVALVVAAVSSLIIYQVPLKTSRPIDKEAEKYVSVKADRVQARLWQDPFEAVSTHQLKEAALKPTHEGHAKSQHQTFSALVHEIKNEGAKVPFLVLPVFVDGNPYANGVESRLKDRYAVVSALGAAGYRPESGEYIRYFEWNGWPKSPLIVPVEWFRFETQESGVGINKSVLVLWLKDQDFDPNPLTSLGNLVAELNGSLDQRSTTYKILGPRFSGSLAAMHEELCRHSQVVSKVPQTHPAGALPAQNFQALDDLLLSYSSLRGINALKNLIFYSSWATAADPVLLDDASGEQPSDAVEGRFKSVGLKLIRTIGTDDALAKELVLELQRRKIDLTKAKKPPHIALISEWDTLYGRSLPRTFVAVAKRMAEAAAQNNAKAAEEKTPVHTLAQHLHALRDEQYPNWVHRYSYLAGLDGELPPKDSGKDTGGAKGKPGDKGFGVEAVVEETPVGRSQLDYLRRLVEQLKREEITSDGEFKAIGVLGSDVYDKLMILQALRNDFPRAIFFTTDLDARLTHSTQGQWARNLIIASHFGLELHPQLQSPIPPFRDSYQTALFYSALQALEYLLPLPVEHAEVRNSVTGVSYSIADTPRLYEVGRGGAVDISLDEPRDIPSIHVPRSDMNPANGILLLPDTLKSVWVVLALGVMVLCALLLNSEFLEQFRLPKLMRTQILTLFLGTFFVSLLLWAISDGAAGEPFSLTEGISVWPTTALRLFAFLLCLVFLGNSWRRLRENDKDLKRRFCLLPSKSALSIQVGSLIGIHHWRHQSSGFAEVALLWQEYRVLGNWRERLVRIVPQSLLYMGFGVMLMVILGFPVMPCRGSACFTINYTVLGVSVLAMMLLIFYVVDATRLCRRLIKIMNSTRITWPDKFLRKEALKRDVDEAYLDELLCVELIAKRTAVISFMLYYPFVILFLMGVARHTYFDRWDFPVALMVIFGLNAAYALGNAVYLRRSAEEAKRTAVNRLKVKMDALSIKTPFKQRKTEQIQKMIDLIEKNQEGAFLPFTQHPVFGAIALPTGGTGLLLLIEYLAKMM